MSPSNKKTHGKAKKPATTPPRTADIAPPVNALSTTSTTLVAFREFIELADLESIKQFLIAASSSPDGENLKLLWARAFKEGFTVGQGSSADTLEEKLEEAHNQGFKEGSSSKVDLFEAGYAEGRRDEQGDWIIEGHGQHCGLQPATIHEDSSIQTDDPPPRVMATSAIQVDTPKPLPPKLCSTPNTMDSAVQTTLLGIQDASSQTLPHPSPIPDSVHATSAPPSSLNWADDAASLPILPSRPPPRDLSILRSSSPKPFSSLQRRSKRSQAHFSQPFRNHKPFPIPRQTFSRRRFRPPHFFSTSFWPSQDPNRVPRFASPSALNWEDDPRLIELSRALNALGWVRP
ncbi:hypothetical protein M413DRAFT_448748 [Hebeloma cylindrosporum]|uniref:Uncharacterized protein n=1 Tax=Hebeloma cylindrosporum TaxID=76867 RepID=A0A0C3BJV5_HEBCY|nr:hypothetical protein M413DRAFT_448748 [Hebeloma cylindrosporum h7]